MDERDCHETTGPRRGLARPQSIAARVESPSARYALRETVQRTTERRISLRGSANRQVERAHRRHAGREKAARTLRLGRHRHTRIARRAAQRAAEAFALAPRTGTPRSRDHALRSDSRRDDLQSPLLKNRNRRSRQHGNVQPGLRSDPGRGADVSPGGNPPAGADLNRAGRLPQTRSA